MDKVKKGIERGLLERDCRRGLVEGGLSERAAFKGRVDRREMRNAKGARTNNRMRVQLWWERVQSLRLQKEVSKLRLEKVYGGRSSKSTSWPKMSTAASSELQCHANRVRKEDFSAIKLGIGIIRPRGESLMFVASLGTWTSWVRSAG